MSDLEIKRKLATIMVADIVGFSRLAAQDEDWTIRALGEFRAVVDEIIARHDGRIFNTGGDSVLTEFASPVEAVRCAVDFQEAARSRNLLQPRDRQLRFRIGLNLGDVMVRGDDLLGDGVNVAARLEALAEPGGICISGTVWDHINGKLSLGYVDIGEQNVKNIPRPVRAYRLRLDAADGPTVQLSPELVQEVPAAPAAAAPPVRRNPWLVPALAAALAVTLAIAGVASWQTWLAPRQAVPPSLHQALVDRLAALMPDMNEAARNATARNYVAAAGHKAGAVPSGLVGYWLSTGRPTPAGAEETVLENCQVFFGQPCVLLAIDDALAAAAPDGRWPPRDMPRARHEGDFEPAQIPGMPNSRTRADIVGYRSAAGPKAAAFGAAGYGRLATVVGRPNQHAAEEEALKTCNEELSRSGGPGSCFLYAVGNRVVLPLRLKGPMTPTAAAEPAPPPAAQPAPAPPGLPAPSASSPAQPAPAAAPAPGPAPAAAVARKPGETFRDCPNCPEMVVVPAGRFLMGVSPHDVERLAMAPQIAAHDMPQHEVTIAKPFAIGKFTVTRAEFAAFVRAANFQPPKGCFTAEPGRGWVMREELDWQNPGFAQTDRDPVVCLSRLEVTAFIDWLRRQTGQPYRLPSEAEWEYAARAGTTTPFYWGEDPRQVCAYGNIGDETAHEKRGEPSFMPCRDGYAETAPVGSFKPNPFGLFDMTGNVLQPTQDCWNETYAGAPSDGSAWTSGECGRIAVRGAAFGANRPFAFRTAQRIPDGPTSRRDRLGFRVVLSLP